LLNNILTRFCFLFKSNKKRAGQALKFRRETAADRFYPLSGNLTCSRNLDEATNSSSGISSAFAWSRLQKSIRDETRMVKFKTAALRQMRK
jgi:hypothetical protein